MRAFVLKEPGVVGYVDVPEPRLTPYGAILRPVQWHRVLPMCIPYLEADPGKPQTWFWDMSAWRRCWR